MSKYREWRRRSFSRQRRFVVEACGERFVVRDLLTDEILGSEESRYEAETWIEYREELRCWEESLAR